MAYYVNGLITDYLVATVGRTFPTNASIRPSGSLFVPVIAPTFVGSDVYRVTFTPDADGAWLFDVTDSVGERWSQTFDVDPISALSLVSSSETAERGTTFRELRLRVATKLGDVTVLQASATAADSVTFIDLLNVGVSSEHLNGRQLYIASGASNGKRARITRTEKQAGRITFTPAVTTPIVSGATAHVYNHRGRGFDIQEYDRILHEVLDNITPLARTDVSIAIGTYSYDNPLIALPVGIAEIYAIEYEAEPGFWYPIEQALDRTYGGWQMERSSASVSLLGLESMVSPGSNLRVLGYGRHAIPVLETDTTTVNPEWIVEEVCHHMCMMGLDRDPKYAQMQPSFERRAAEKRRMVRTLKRTGSVRVR